MCWNIIIVNALDFPLSAVFFNKTFDRDFVAFRDFCVRTYFVNVKSAVITCVAVGNIECVFGRIGIFVFNDRADDNSIFDSYKFIIRVAFLNIFDRRCFDLISCRIGRIRICRINVVFAFDIVAFCSRSDSESVVGVNKDSLDRFEFRAVASLAGVVVENLVDSEVAGNFECAVADVCVCNGYILDFYENAFVSFSVCAVVCGRLPFAAFRACFVLFERSRDFCRICDDSCFRNVSGSEFFDFGYFDL